MGLVFLKNVRHVARATSKIDALTRRLMATVEGWARGPFQPGRRRTVAPIEQTDNRNLLIRSGTIRVVLASGRSRHSVGFRTYGGRAGEYAGRIVDGGLRLEALGKMAGLEPHLMTVPRHLEIGFCV
jgi:hypothetical protein